MKLFNPVTWTLLITPTGRFRANGAAGSLRTDKPIVPDRRAVMLGQLIAAHADQLLGIPSTRRAPLLDGLPLMATVDPDLNAAVRYELKNVLGNDAADRNDLAEWIGNKLAAPSAAHNCKTLWALLGGDDRSVDEWPTPATDDHRRSSSANSSRWLRQKHVWLVRQAAAAVMNLTICATVVTAWVLLWLMPGASPPSLDWPTLALKGFALWCFAFLPCWLYVRFLGQRAGALWDEYVLNLHRLGWDKPQFLPRPPRSSQFYREWADDGGRLQMQDRNIYRQKFNAYYGRSVADTGSGEDFRVQLDTLFPVFLTAAVLAVGWMVTLWDDASLQEPANIWDVMKFGFLGAYVFIVQMLLRRFFAGDLRPSAYASAVLRITVVLVSVAAIYQLLEIWLAGNADIRRWEAVVAFAIGFIPVVATQVLIRAASAPLRVASRSLDSDYPLSQLDGLNIWYEAQLADENIDDMQTLATANFVDVVLHTRVPVGRLVDWVDQAYLFLHLDRVEHGAREHRRAHKESSPAASEGTRPAGETDESAALSASKLLGSSVGSSSRGGTWTRTLLRQHGVRTATDLLKAFPIDRVDGGDQRAWAEGLGLATTMTESELTQIRTLIRVLGEEQGLAPVWNWYDRGVIARCSQRRPGSVQTCASSPPTSGTHR